MQWERDLREVDISLEKTTQLCIASELTKAQMKQMHDEDHNAQASTRESKHVDAVKHKQTCKHEQQIKYKPKEKDKVLLIAQDVERSMHHAIAPHMANSARTVMRLTTLQRCVNRRKCMRCMRKMTSQIRDLGPVLSGGFSDLGAPGEDRHGDPYSHSFQSM